MAEPGPEVMARFVGPENVERGRAYLEQLDPELHRYIIDFVYGEVYAGDTLDPKTRALCTVAMLACLGQQLQLGVYVRAARRQGASRRRSARCCARSPCTPGFPSAWNALATMQRRSRASTSETRAHELLARADRGAGRRCGTRRSVRPRRDPPGGAGVRPARRSSRGRCIEEAARGRACTRWELYAELSVDPTACRCRSSWRSSSGAAPASGCRSSCRRWRSRRSARPRPTSSSSAGRRSASARPGDLRLAALAVTEPSGGSDVRSIQTRARKDGERLGHRRPEGVHRQRRHRRHPRRGRHRRPRGRPPRPGRLHRPQGHAGPDACCASSTSSAAGRRTPARSSSRTAACRPTTCSAARSD